MKSELLFALLGELEDDVVLMEPPARRAVSRKMWAGLAACLALAAVCLGLARWHWPGWGTERITLEDGSQMVFLPGDSVSAGQFSADMNVISRPLTQEEAGLLFAGLPVTGSVIYEGSGSGKILGVQGILDGLRVRLSLPGVQLSDVVVEGTEATSRLYGYPVTAGYFLTRPNSRRERTLIYYASAQLEGGSL